VQQQLQQKDAMLNLFLIINTSIVG